MRDPFSSQNASILPIVQRQSALDRVLAFTGLSIDDVINDPIARNQVWGYFKLQKQISRRSDISELERQWNSVGMRGPRRGKA